MRIWSSVCVVRNELTKIWMSEARRSVKMIVALWQYRYSEFCWLGQFLLVNTLPDNTFFIRGEGGEKAAKTYSQEFYLKLHVPRAVRAVTGLNFNAQFQDSTGARGERHQPPASFIYRPFPSFVKFVLALGKFSPFIYATQTLRVSRGIALLFSRNFGTRRGVGGQPHAPAAFTPGKGPVPIVQEAGWAPGPVQTGGKSRPHRDSIPDRPARIQSLYILSYPTQCLSIILTYICSQKR